MNRSHDELTPPLRLALAYAPHTTRDRFGLLLRLDTRCASIVGNASEPLFGQIKLAWWRDALLAAPADRPKGEPLLAQYYELDDPWLVSAASALIDGWETLVVQPEWSPELTQIFAVARGRAVFGWFGQQVGETPLAERLGEEWAVNDLRAQFGRRVGLLPLDLMALPSKHALRPLTILTMSVREISGIRLVWHALTGY